MTKVSVHLGVFKDIKLCTKKKWHKNLGIEMPKICRLLVQNGKMPGERPVHYVKDDDLKNKTFHAGINLPDENVGKRKGPRIIYIKEDFDSITIIYVGGHKDKRYDDSVLQVALIEERNDSGVCVEYTENLDFNEPNVD